MISKKQMRAGSSVGISAMALLLSLLPAQLVLAQQQPQEESDGPLTATINGSSFTTGDTITISGTVEERDINSYASIEVIDPNSETVESDSPSITADNTFTYSFQAGINSQFDTTPMEASGNYRVLVRYQDPSEDITSENYFREVEFIFAYQHVPEQQQQQSTTTTPTTAAPQQEERNTVRRTINVSALNYGVMQGLDAIQELNASIYSNSSQANMLGHLQAIHRAFENIQGNLTGVTPMAQGDVPIGGANNVTTPTNTTTPTTIEDNTQRQNDDNQNNGSPLSSETQQLQDLFG